MFTKKQKSVAKRGLKLVEVLLFGETANSSQVESAKNHVGVARTVKPERRPAYNDWCVEYKVSTLYHIKQTNNPWT